jgi:hypothetical protein
MHQFSSKLKKKKIKLLRITVDYFQLPMQDYFLYLENDWGERIISTSINPKKENPSKNERSVN